MSRSSSVSLNISGSSFSSQAVRSLAFKYGRRVFHGGRDGEMKKRFGDGASRRGSGGLRRRNVGTRIRGWRGTVMVRGLCRREVLPTYGGWQRREGGGYGDKSTSEGHSTTRNVMVGHRRWYFSNGRVGGCRGENINWELRYGRTLVTGRGAS